MRSKEQTHYLGQEKIPKLMLKFSIPCILSLLVSALYNIVDQVFIGNSEMSALGNAATGVVFPIFIIAQAFAWCFGDGCAAYLNICQGKKDTKNATACIGSGITITLLVSLILMAVFFFPLKEQILTLFGASENTIGMAVEYFNIILAFFPSQYADEHDELGDPGRRQSRLVYGLHAVRGHHKYHPGPGLYFRLPLGNVRRGSGYGHRPGSVLCDQRHLLLPHQDVPAVCAEFYPPFPRVLRRSKTGGLLVCHPNNHCDHLPGL